MRPPVAPRDLHLHGAVRVARHVLGERLTRGVGRRVAARIAAQLDARGDGGLEPVPRRADLDAEALIREYILPGRPVLLEGAAASWPVAGWSPEWLAAHQGDLPVILMRVGPDDLRDRDHTPYHTTLGEAVAGMGEGNRWYTRFVPLFDRVPALREHLDLAWLRDRRGPMARGGNLQLFLGGAGTATATHHAIGCNLFTQAYGHKDWVLYAPEWSVALDPPPTRTPYFFSDFDPHAPDLDAMPLCRHLRGYEVRAGPGDVLYVPPFWWHKVRNPDPSIGIGFRWHSLPTLRRVPRSQVLLTILATHPPIPVVWLHDMDFTRTHTHPRRHAGRTGPMPG